MVTFCLLLFVTNIDLADGDIAYGDELGAGFIINLEIGYLCRIVGILEIENDFETDIFSDFLEYPVTLRQFSRIKRRSDNCLNKPY